MKKLLALQAVLLRPRYLRAIPSLMVLTTAMAWGVMPDSDAADNVHKKAGVTVSINQPASGVGSRGPLAD